ncbi:MAG: M20/M25/M40 family metallo-hydrolase, partial [Chitinophagaceae bacterium]
KKAWTRADEAAKAGAKAVVFYDNYGAKYPLKYNPKSELDSLPIPVVFVGNREWKVLVDGGASFLEVNLNVHLETKKLTGYNVAAFIDNHQPLTVVLGAHYDHLGHGEDGGSLYTGKVPQIHNGADDNASGTAALLQLGKWLKKSKLKNYNYLLLHFSGEELGLLGSKAFAKNTGMDSTHIAYMINMDMVGRLVDSTKALTVGGVGSSPSWGMAAASLKRQGFNLKIDSSGIGPSDHTSFYEKGIPVLFFFTGTHSDYHKPSDDADKINYPGEILVIRGIEKIVTSLDAAPRPRFTKTKTSNLGRVSFKVTLGIMPDYSWEGEGLRIDGIIDNRPAQKAGLQTGDIIIQLGKDKVKGIQTYMEALSHEQEGAKTTVVVLRGGKRLEFHIEL